MAFALETILLAALCMAHGWDMQDTEIVLLPLWNTEDRTEVDVYYTR